MIIAVRQIYFHEKICCDGQKDVEEIEECILVNTDYIIKAHDCIDKRLCCLLIDKIGDGRSIERVTIFGRIANLAIEIGAKNLINL